MTSNRQRYRELCDYNLDPPIPLFSRAWWLDTVCGSNGWDVIFVEKGDQIHAALPLIQKRKYLGIKAFGMPPLTQTLGPWLRQTSTKPSTRLAREKALMEELITQIPTPALFSQNFNHSIKNWLPWYWAGYKQTTRYTYRLERLDNLGLIWDGLGSNIRREIRKAKERFHLTIRSDASITTFLELNRMVFNRQGKRLPYSESLVRRLDQTCAERGCRRIIMALDPEGNYHAGVYVVWDENSAYYLMGGGDPALRNSGSTSLAMWEAICFAAKVTRAFDFEGSMIEPIERFFRAFGASQVPYYTIYGGTNRLLTALMQFRGIRSTFR